METRVVAGDDHPEHGREPLRVALPFQIEERARRARRERLRHAAYEELTRELARSRHRFGGRHERREARLALAQILFARDRQLQRLDEIAGGVERRAADHVALHRPVERLAVAADDLLRDLRIEALGVEEDTVHVEDDVGDGTAEPRARAHSSRSRRRRSVRSTITPAAGAARCAPSRRGARAGRR